MNLPRIGNLYSVWTYLGKVYCTVMLTYLGVCTVSSKSVLYSVWTYLGRGILYSVLTYLGGWAVWVGLCIKITPDLPKIQGKTINSVPELTFS